MVFNFKQNKKTPPKPNILPFNYLLGGEEDTCAHTPPPPDSRHAPINMVATSHIC